MSSPDPQDPAPDPTAAGEGMTFRNCPACCPLRITQVLLSDEAAFRLSEMGIRVGSTAQVTHRAAFGGRVVDVAGGRLAIDQGTADLIHVSPVEDPE